MESMLSNRLLTEPRGPPLTRFPIGCCTSEGQSVAAGVTEGLGHAS